MASFALVGDALGHVCGDIVDLLLRQLPLERRHPAAAVRDLLRDSRDLPSPTGWTSDRGRHCRLSRALRGRRRSCLRRRPCQLRRCRPAWCRRSRQRVPCPFPSRVRNASTSSSSSPARRESWLLEIDSTPSCATAFSTRRVETPANEEDDPDGRRAATHTARPCGPPPAAALATQGAATPPANRHPSRLVHHTRGH
jgi:hypothetical protein